MSRLGRGGVRYLRAFFWLLSGLPAGGVRLVCMSGTGAELIRKKLNRGTFVRGRERRAVAGVHEGFFFFFFFFCEVAEREAVTRSRHEASAQ